MTDTRPAPTSQTTLKPYLTLPQLFSLTWLAYPVLSLLFVAFRLQISSADAQNAVSDAKGSLLTSCKAAETAATSAASLPRIMAQTSNAQIVDAVNGTLNAARATLVLALTIMEAVIEFIIDMYRSTFLCFVELVVRGGLSLLISASQEITNFLNSTLKGIASALQSEVDVANSAINAAISAINKVGSIFGGNLDIQPISLGSLDALSNVQIPNDFTNALVSLNSSLPTLDQLRDAIDKVIEVPFEDLKAEINNTFSAIHFDASALPVPQQNRLSFCSTMDTSVVDRLGVDLLQVTKIATILLIVIAFMLIAGNCLLEWYKYRSMMNSLENTRRAWLTDPTIMHSTSNSGTPAVHLTDYNLMELIAMSQHPLVTRIVNTFSQKLRLSRETHIKMRWFFSYVFHPPALACLLIGAFGLLSVELQIAALGPIAHRYEGEVAGTVSDFTDLIATSINTSMRNDSTTYASAANAQVDSIQTTINDGMFGWVEGTTSTLNNTLVTFYAEVQSVVESVFGNTPLEGPAQEFIRCILGTKVTAFENALTFLHDNLRVDIPRVSDDVLLLSNATVNEVTQPISLAAVGDQSTSSDGGLVGRLITRYVASLKKERIMFLVFLGLWGLVVIMALCIISYHSGRESRLRRLFPSISQTVFNYKKARWEREARSFNSSTYLAARNVDTASAIPLNAAPSGTFKLGYSDGRKQRSSWESFVEKNEEPAMSKPRKLIALGRRARRGEQLVPDWYEHPAPPAYSETGASASLWLRIKNMFNRPETDEDWVAPPASQRPNLTVDTHSVLPSSIPQPPSTADSPRHTWIPPPAWSFKPTSPQPAPKIVSTSVTGVERMHFPAPPQNVPTLNPVPLHSYFARDVPVDMPRSPTDFLSHSRGSSLPTSPPPVPQSMNMAGVGAMRSSPTGQFLTAAPVSRNTANPFKNPTNPFMTPFDEPTVSPFTDSAASKVNSAQGDTGRVTVV